MAELTASSSLSLFSKVGLRIAGNGLGSAVIGGAVQYNEMKNNGTWGGSDINDDWAKVSSAAAMSGLLGMVGTAVGEGITVLNGGLNALNNWPVYGGIPPKFENMVSPTTVSAANSISWFISSGSSGFFAEDDGAKCACN